jgi:hypothetical protein
MNIISYSLWGTNPRYLKGAIENVKAAKIHYPDWTCRLYIDETLPMEFCKEMKKRYDNVEFYMVQNTVGSWYGLFTRFFVADDPNVDRYIIRDCDSRLSKREADAVQEWVKSGLPFHCMFDHPWHSGVPILGGMWGAIKGCLPDMNQLIHTWIGQNKIMQKGPDQFFLRDIIWPVVKDVCMIHDEVSLPQYRNPKAIKFPTPREGYRFIGECFDENNNPAGDAAHPEHWKVLKDFLEGKPV